MIPIFLPYAAAPVCGSRSEEALWLSASIRADLAARAAAPPTSERDLPSPWGIERYGDIVIMRDQIGDAFSSRDQLDTYAIYDAFYRFYDVYPDDYDFITFLTVEDSSSSTSFAFYSPIGNDARGIGQDVYDYGYEIDGMLFMNSWQYWVGANETFTSAVFGQELGHRWGAYVGYDLGDGEVHTDTLGRDASHWSYWLESSNSPMEGNAWTDRGDGSFALDAQEEVAYSDLDLYLMGLIPSSQVAPFFLIEDPSGLQRFADSAPEYYATGQDQTVQGVRQDITIDDVIRAEGARVPAVGSSQTSFRMAVVLLVPDQQQPDANNVGGAEAARTAFEAVWEDDTQGLASLDLTLGDVEDTPLDVEEFGAPVTVPTAAW